jgi:hypothetical protein
MVTERQRLGAGFVVAPLIAGAAGALSNFVNFTGNRTAYFVIWGAAHLAAFAIGFWAAQRWRPSDRVSTYVGFGAVAGAVEAVIVFGVVDGFLLGEFELVTGLEDVLAVFATILLFSTGAVYGLRQIDRRSLSKEGIVTFLNVATPVVTLLAAVFKL